MFTGIIEAIGRIERVEALGPARRFAVACPEFETSISTGDSIAIDGCCLTAETVIRGGFTCFATPETLLKTTLGDRRAGDGVNLERALAFGDRLGGHLVSGHVDATGSFRSAREVGESREVWIELPPEFHRHCIPKGSIAIDGISLTVVELADSAVSLWIIPETWARTTLSRRRPGDRVNIETDLLGKYVFRFLEAREPGRDARIGELLASGGWGARAGA